MGEDAPASAGNTVQVHVSRLRKALGGTDIVQPTSAGYRLTVGPGEVDLERFQQLTHRGRAALVAMLRRRRLVTLIGAAGAEEALVFASIAEAREAYGRVAERCLTVSANGSARRPGPVELPTAARSVPPRRSR